ncbi:hypothetical protein [Nocardia mangyaensis]|uniref:hypothetical protein n=1 Tax=Nocardia mangyaensis TaxID=2213200 RepID=UPI0026775A17|nr:hypothetical protein [Nocardia mangyaensis]MDO3645678.1 hypothetical protein [Nocardia mangyaensis]
MADRIDYGQAEISAFNDAARAGQFSFDPTAVDEVVGLYDQMIQGLTKIRHRLGGAVDGSGFGAIPSANELQQGFSNKAIEGQAVLGDLIDGAMRLQEAYLRAAGKFEDADALNSRRILLLSNELDGGA